MSRDAVDGSTAARHEYVDGEYLGYNPDWHESDAAWKAERVAVMARRHLPKLRTVCDVGCGTGAVLDRLATGLTAERLVGIEPSPQARAMIPKERRDRIDVHPDRSAIRDETFDLMLMLDVFEHVEDYLGFLRDHRDLARNAIFHIPLDMTVQAVARARPFAGARSQLGHLHYFSRETALATLKDAGFMVVDQQVEAPRLQLPSNGWRVRAAKIPRRLAWAANHELTARWLGGCSLLVFARTAQ